MMKAPQKLCSNRKFMQEFQKTGKQIEKSCYRPNLQIKCSHRDSSCDCSTKKKHRFQAPSRQHMKFQRKQKHFFPPKRRKPSKGTWCFQCNKKGHFAKDCPKKEKSKFVQKTFQSNPKLDDDIGSLYSETEEQTPRTAFIIDKYSKESETETDSDSFLDS